MASRTLAVVVVVVIASASPSAMANDAACTLEPPTLVVDRPNHPVPSDGGVVVAAGFRGSGNSSGDISPEGAIAVPDARFRTTTGEVPARVVQLAAGLARIVPETPFLGSATLELRDESIAVRFETRPPAFASTAPRLVRATLRSRRTRIDGVPVLEERVRVVLDRMPPSATVWLVLFEGDDPVGRLQTVLPIEGGRGPVIDVTRTSPCSARSWPYAMPASGDQVSVAFVDGSGRLSPRSRSVVLR